MEAQHAEMAGGAAPSEAPQNIVGTDAVMLGATEAGGGGPSSGMTGSGQSTPAAGTASTAMPERLKQAAAKERNRQAQRRFREKQKGLIKQLTDQLSSLDAQLKAAQAENASLRVALAQSQEQLQQQQQQQQQRHAQQQQHLQARSPMLQQGPAAELVQLNQTAVLARSDAAQASSALAPATNQCPRQPAISTATIGGGLAISPWTGLSTHTTNSSVLQPSAHMGCMFPAPPHHHSMHAQAVAEAALQSGPFPQVAATVAAAMPDTTSPGLLPPSSTAQHLHVTTVAALPAGPVTDRAAGAGASLQATAGPTFTYWIALPPPTGGPQT